MKKRAMKKWIPKNTAYCLGCKWHRYIKTLYLHASPTTTKSIHPSEYTWSLCNYRDDCEGKARCWTTPEYSCSKNVYRCEYLGITDFNKDTLLWDGCKECNEHMPKRRA